MRFIDVALDGQPFARAEWESFVEWNADGHLQWHDTDVPYSPSIQDLTADDWEFNKAWTGVLVAREDLEEAWNKAIKDDAITCDDLARELGL